MALGIPNRLIVLAIVAGALIIPERLRTASGVVTDVSTGISTSLSALGSTRIEPVFNPSIGLGGNIGEGLVSRFFGAADAEVVEVSDVGGGGIQDRPAQEAERQKEREAEEAEDVEVDPDPKGIGLIEGG